MEDLPVSQNRVVDNEDDEIYSEEIDMLEDQNDITYSPGILDVRRFTKVFPGMVWAKFAAIQCKTDVFGCKSKITNLLVHQFVKLSLPRVYHILNPNYGNIKTL